MRWMGLFVALGLVAQDPVLTFETCLARLRAPAEVLAAETFLGARQRELMETAHLLREGPTLTLSGGPRRGEGRSQDRSLEVELPLFLRPGVRKMLEGALAHSGPVLRKAARLEGERKVRQAFLDCWLAQEEAHLKTESLETAKAWHAAAQNRVAAGADAPFEATLVAGERVKAEGELREARARLQEAWANLRTLVDLPAEPQGIEDPGPAGLPALEGMAGRFEGGTLVQALVQRAATERAALGLRQAVETSRWSLVSGYQREGNERVATLGVGLRLPRVGEPRVLEAAAERERQQIRQEHDTARVALEGRFRQAMARIAVKGSPPSPSDWVAALAALDLRLREGKDRPSQALPQRRQLLEAQEAELRQRHNDHLLSLELSTLTR